MNMKKELLMEKMEKIKGGNVENREIKIFPKEN